jgi:hypothetical protein
VVATALAFGLTLLALVYFIGPVSGSHVNPAVPLGALLTGRIALSEASATGSPSSAAESSAHSCCGKRSAARRSTAGRSPAWAPTATAASR